jgi:hypothetical protein
MTEVKDKVRVCMYRHYEETVQQHTAMLLATTTGDLHTGFEVAVKHLKLRLRMKACDLDLLHQHVFEPETDPHTDMVTATDPTTSHTMTTVTRPTANNNYAPPPPATLVTRASPAQDQRPNKRSRTDMATPPAGSGPSQHGQLDHTPARPNPRPDSAVSTDNNSGGPTVEDVDTPHRPTMATVHPSIRSACGLGDRAITVKPATRYLVIGDSNLRNLSIDVPDQVQIECFPGAQIHNITSLLLKGIAHKQLKQIYINVGINDRDNDFQQTTDKKLRTLAATLKHLGVQSYFVAIPTDQRRSLTHCTNIESMNRAARGLFHDVLQLPVNQVGEDLVHLTTTAYTALGKRLTTRIRETEAADITRIFPTRQRTLTN